MPDFAPPQAHEKYQRLIAAAQKHPAMATAVVHPCDAVSLESASEAARIGLLKPILVGPVARVRDVAQRASIDSRTRVASGLSGNLARISSPSGTASSALPASTICW